MSDIDLDVIEARANAATEGPWEWQTLGLPVLMGWAGDPDTYHYESEVLEFSHDGGCCCRQSCTAELMLSEQDKAFVAAARTDVPALIAELREARAKLARVEGLCTPPTDSDHAMLCGHFGGRGCFRPSCSCWCHGTPEGVVSKAALRRIVGGDPC